MKLLGTAAGRAVAVLFFGLLFAALLQAEGLRKQAEIQPGGFKRDLALEVTGPLVRVSRELHLTTPRHELQVAIGRASEDTVDTQVHLSLPPLPPLLPPPARPLPKRRHTGTHGQPKPRFTAAKPLRIWVAGDSLAQVPGQALERLTNPALQVVAIESRLSTGLTRPDLYNWFSRIQIAPTELKPNVAMFSFGADDAHDFMAGVPAGKSVGRIGSPSWNAEYRRRVDGVTRELNTRGIRVVWLGLPIPDGSSFKQNFAIVNAILQSVVAAHPETSTYIDTWHILVDAHGRFAPYLRVHGKLTLMRLPDGVHYTSAAGDLIAQQLLKQLGAIYRFG